MTSKFDRATNTASFMHSMLCPETHSESREDICSSYQLTFLQHVYLRYAVRVQNGPKTSIYQQRSLTSNQLPTALAKFSPDCPAPSALSRLPLRLLWVFTPLVWLGVAAMGSCPFEKGEILGSCLPFIPHIMAGTQEMEEKTSVLVGGKQNTGAAQKHSIVFTAPTHPVIPCPGRTLPAPRTLLDGLLCPILGRVPAQSRV